jgi:hypothetical protein
MGAKTAVSGDAFIDNPQNMAHLASLWHFRHIATDLHRFDG